MTCIVGIKHDGGVWIGGDSAGSAGHSIAIRADPKVFRVGPAVIGFTSSFRMGQALMFGWTVPKRHGDVDLFEWMCTDFIDAVRARLASAGFRRRENEEESGGVFLVGVEGGLFRIDSDFQVGVDGRGYDAVGCGEDLAKGSLFTTGGDRPAERIKTALAAAAAHSAWVAPPFLVIGPKPEASAPSPEATA